MTTLRPHLPSRHTIAVAAIAAGFLVLAWRTGRGPFRTIPVSTIYGGTW
ncbi:hypothetical protein [Rhodococcus zopfii]|nr:hypothetical protein [Rhodococcus zopfii]